MPKRGVYVVHYSGDNHRLTVTFGGKAVEMDTFVKTHTPVQVTGLTNLNPGAKAPNFLGLIIAEGPAPADAETAKPPERRTLPKGRGKREILGAFK